MADKTDIKPETLPDLDDLLQCPVCYEIPTEQIFQCNQGHHVCGRCKARLVECPVCRDLFFGTRNYAMEELIASVRKLRAFKLGGKVTVGTAIDDPPPVDNGAAGDSENNTAEDEDTNDNSSQSSQRAPPACKGLFRCLCCINGNAERLPVARMLNHLRYFHSPLLIEGSSENGEYLQAWQFPTTPGRIVTAIRISDMGIFFLIIEINFDLVCSWISMLAAPWVAHEFCYTVTISGCDREAIFSDSVWSVRSCEGSLKKRGHCLMLTGMDAQALTTPQNIGAKISIRRTPADQPIHQTQPRVVMRVANRGTTREVPLVTPRETPREPTRGITRNILFPMNHSILEPFLNEIQRGVARLSRTISTHQDADYRNDENLRSEDALRITRRNGSNEVLEPRGVENGIAAAEPSNTDNMSRNARRRMRQRLRAALNDFETAPQINEQANQTRRQNGHTVTVGINPMYVRNLGREPAAISEPLVVRNIPSAIIDVPQPSQPSQPSTVNPTNNNSQNQSTRRNNRRRRQRR